MKESLLNALVQLFALIAHSENSESNTEAVNVVESFLIKLLGKKLSRTYLDSFNEYYNKYQSKKSKKRISSNSVKVLAICSKINEELQQDEKLLVLIKLLEFIHYDGINDTKLEFVDTVAESFNIEHSEYKDCKDLVLSDSVESIKQKNNTLVISSVEEDDGVSNHLYHKGLKGALIVLHIDSINSFVLRLLSADDTLSLNGQPVLPNSIYLWATGSSIRGEKISPIYYNQVSSVFLKKVNNDNIVFSAYDLEYNFPKSTNGLHNFNFQAKGGELIGVMGGSGAGKSTLLNIFNGSLEPKKGQVLINGYDVYKDTEEIKGLIGFVPQDDLLIEELTVYQNLYYSAKLCLDNFSEQELEESVTRVLLDLDLNEIRDLKVGSPLNKFISGGQRKRLNIALELIREPSVLFVDEPTSGLSSNDSEMVMDLLKEQTNKGKLAIINIHQPSSDIYKLFDELIVMDKGGHPIYYGNPVDAITYFKEASNYVNANESECSNCGNVNPEQVLQIVESRVVDEHGKLTGNRKHSPEEWYKMYKENSEQAFELPQKEPLPHSAFKIPSKIKQFIIFVKRDIKSKLTNKQYLLLTFLEAPILALILAYFTKYSAKDTYIFSLNDNIISYLFMAVVVALFLGLTVSAEEIIKDRKILQRERFLNLSKASYFNSKVIIQFAISAVQTASFVLLGNLILGINGLNLEYWLILFSASAFSNILGLNISAALNSVVTIYILIPFILVPQLLLSGVIVNFNKLHGSIASDEYVPVVGDVMVSRWAYEALAVNQFMNNEYDKNTYYYDQKINEYTSTYVNIIPELHNINTYIHRNISKFENENKVSDYLTILHNELLLLGEQTNVPFKQLESINAMKWNEKLYNQIDKYLELTKRKFVKARFKWVNKLDDKIMEMEETLGKETSLLQLKKDNHNDNLSDLLTAKNEFDKLVVKGDKLVKRMCPVYKMPDNKYGRAHFYAPYKKLGEWLIPTFWFNIGVIWLAILLMYISLRLDFLKRALGKIENLMP